MKTLIIRTDKLGDFYVTMPYINSLVKKFGKKNIDIIVSENIFEHFKKKDYFFHKIYSFPHKNFYKKLCLLRNHGLSGRDTVQILGYNSRLDTFQSIVGNWLLPKTKSITNQRIKNAKYYMALTIH